MKNVLLATTILVAGVSAASAEVTLSGDARMGVVNSFADVVSFSSRARVKFTLSGETDSGLSFGASFRADNADAASSGTAGSVFISGAFGTLTMGDLDGAAQNAVGQVSGVGYTGIGDLNEITYIAGGTATDVNYEYTSGAVTGYLSAGQITTGTNPWALGVKYAGEGFSVSVGYENNDAGSTHTVLGATGTFSGVTLKAVYGTASGTIDGSQYALSASYTANAITGTIFLADDSDVGGAKGYGLGASYDLGGGAAFTAGYAVNQTADTDSYDAGVTFSF